MKNLLMNFTIIFVILLFVVASFLWVEEIHLTEVETYSVEMKITEKTLTVLEMKQKFLLLKEAMNTSVWK